MAFTHNSKLASSEPPWRSVDKTKLPRAAFAGQGVAEKKSTWSYPHHWVKGSAMYLHRGGLNTAWSAAQGARSGKKASPDIIAHLEDHRKALGLTNGKNAIMPLYNTTWAILEDSLREILSYKVESIEAFFDVTDAPALSLHIVDGVAEIQMRGPLFKRSNILTMLGIGTSLEEATDLFHQAQESTDVKEIHHIFDTPGGQVNGTRAYAQMLAGYKGVKKNVAIVDNLCASAGFWIASQCDEIVATDKTNLIGSIGVIMQVQRDADDSAVIVTNDSAPLKNGDPASPEGYADYKRIANGLATIFEEDVAEGRGTTIEDIHAHYGKGSVLLAEEALSVGMIDKIAQTYGGKNMTITLEKLKAEAPEVLEAVLAEAKVPELKASLTDATEGLSAATAKITRLEAEITALRDKIPAPADPPSPEVAKLLEEVAALKKEKLESRLSFLDDDTRAAMVALHTEASAEAFTKIESTLKSLTDKINALGGVKGDSTIPADKTFDEKVEEQAAKLIDANSTLSTTEAYVQAAKTVGGTSYDA